MKTEINNENKAKFFALYWRQYVLSDGIEIGGNVGDCEEEMFLLLKPLSQISDEDKKEVCNFLEITFNRDTSYGFEEFYVSNQTIYSYLSDDSVSFNLDCYDYLRSKGYALPWMGLSVEEMIEAGWIKLTK